MKFTYTDKKNSFWLAVYYISTLIFAFVNLKLNLLNYGNTLLGIWILLLSLWNLGNAFDFGLGTAVVKFVAQYSEEDSAESRIILNKIVNTSFLFFIAIGLVLFFVLFFIGYQFYIDDARMVGVNSKNNFLLIHIFLGSAFVFKYISIFFRSIFEGLNNFILPSKLNILSNFLIFSMVFIAYFFNLNLVSLSIFYLINSLVFLSLFVIMFFYSIKGIEFRRTNFDKNFIKKIFSFSIKVQSVSFISALLDPILKYLIGFYYAPGFITYYEIANKFAYSLSGLFFTTFKNYLAKASSLTNDKVKEFIYGKAVMNANLGITYSGVVFGVAAFFISILIHLWFDVTESIVIFLILALPHSINNFGYVIYVTLIGTSRAGFLAVMQLINLLLIVIFFGVFSYFDLFYFALTGYFFSTTIVNFLMMRYIGKHFDISIKKYLSLVSFEKLIGLVLLISSTLIFIALSDVGFLLPVAALSLISVILFYKNIKNAALLAVGEKKS